MALQPDYRQLWHILNTLPMGILTKSSRSLEPYLEVESSAGMTSFIGAQRFLSTSSSSSSPPDESDSNPPPPEPSRRPAQFTPIQSIFYPVKSKDPLPSKNETPEARSQPAPPFGQNVALAAIPVRVPKPPYFPSNVLEIQKYSLRARSASALQRKVLFRVLFRYYQSVQLSDVAQRHYFFEKLLMHFLDPIGGLARPERSSGS